MSNGAPGAASTLGIGIFQDFPQVSQQGGAQRPPEQEQK